jgi:hypothetical protein
MKVLMYLHEVGSMTKHRRLNLNPRDLSPGIVDFMMLNNEASDHRLRYGTQDNRFKRSS